MALGLNPGLESLEGPSTVVVVMCPTHLSTASGNLGCSIAPIILYFHNVEVLFSFLFLCN